ncbi:concanavalin A-like lectin/glucanase domain-containing protein [Trichophaea hybrida]|nr:concanavalin A-like lectin/glucanase domain-containing protein [Trichophaea hybrida]
MWISTTTSTTVSATVYTPHAPHGKFFRPMRTLRADKPSVTLSSGLIHASNTSIYLGADYTSLAPHGRSSVRLESKERYTKGLFILDVDHIPYSCGVWPAFWTYAHPWPSEGEIDIIEGVHEQSSNSIVIHTPTDLCTCPPSTLEPGVPSPAMDQYVKIEDPRRNSYGSPGFAGGVYTMEWTGIAWVPVECGMKKLRSGHRLVFNITFCGEWAGLESVWGESGW